MKNARKLTSILLLIAMLFMIAAPAMAEGEGGNQAEKGTITISNAVVGQTYTIYKILTLESYSGVGKTPDENGNYTGGNYAYKAASDKWSAFINRDDIKGTYVNVDAQGYVTWIYTEVDGKKVPADAAAFAKLAQTYAKEQSISPAKDAVTATAPASDSKATTTTVTFDELDLGYYLMDSTLGVLCSLDTTNPDVKIKEKNEGPGIEKKVQEDSLESAQGNGWQDTNDADINQVVNFKTTVHAKKGAQNYVVHDKMSAGLTFDGADKVTIKVGDTELIKKSDTNTTNYQYEVVTSNLEATDPCDFHIVFTQKYLDTITADTDIVITYSATLNENAVIAGKGNPNETKLDYGDSQFTEWDKTITYTWQGDVFKYTDGESGRKIALKDAKFELSRDIAGDQKIQLVLTTSDSTNGNEYRLATSKDAANNIITEITTNESGKFFIKGLDADTYYLTETAAPAGYNKLSGPIKVVISNSPVENNPLGLTSLVNYYSHTGNSDNPYNETDETAKGSGTIEVLNGTGTELPSTGGIGTTIFYVVGAALVVGAGVLLVTKKRMTGQR